MLARLRAEYPEAYDATEGYQVRVTPLKAQLTTRARPTLLLLLGTAFLVLVIACANLANLTLTRVLGRDHELAIRVSLGASRATLRRELLAESFVFVTRDLEDAQKVVITNESMARAYFGDRDPIGRRIAWKHELLNRYDGVGPEWRTVVGVVADTRYNGLDADVVHTMYNPAGAADRLARGSREPRPRRHCPRDPECDPLDQSAAAHRERRHARRPGQPIGR